MSEAFNPYTQERVQTAEQYIEEITIEIERIDRQREYLARMVLHYENIIDMAADVQEAS